MTDHHGPVGLTIEAAQAPIHTRRLVLRAPAAGDIPQLARQIDDPVVARFTAMIPHPYPPILARRFVAFCAQSAGTDLSAHFLLALKSNPRLIVGGASISWTDGAAPEIGYWIAASYRRRGFAGETVRALLHRVFSSHAAQRVCAWVHIANPVSQRVLKRAGFRVAGGGKRHARSQGRHVPVVHLSLGRAAWRKRATRV